MNRKSAMVPSLLLLAACSVVDPRRASLDLNALSHEMGEPQAMALSSRLEWRCGDDAQNRHLYGQRVCDGLLESLNSAPASRIDFMFRDGHLSAMIVQYPSDEYKAMKAAVEANLGASFDRNFPRSPLAGAFGPGANLVGWKSNGGIVMTSRDDENGDGNLMLAWISNQELARYSGK
jgi:hypothetical protein